MFSIMELLLINQYAQKIKSKEEVDEWINSLNENERKEVVRMLWYLCLQARVRLEDIYSAAKMFEMRSAKTPIMMMCCSKATLKERGFRLVALTGKELVQGVWLLIECFSIADKRRRDVCQQNCSHWWHKDLSNPKLVKKILKDNENSVN